LDRVDLKPIAADQAAAVFRRCRAGAPVSAAEVAGLQAHLLRWLGGEYARRGWTLLLHLGALRDTSTRTAQTVGAAGGYAAMGPSLDVVPLCRLLDDLEEADHLPRTVLFPLNPGDTEMLATLAGSFRREGLPAAVQLGPAWWYNDHRDGIRRQLCAVANHGLLGRFIGMTTDARCLLSMLRHQYFRRIFCGLLGDWVEAGELPDDQALLAELIGAVCHDNAARQLGLSGQTEKAS
ncbi:MAG: glucuronate isomerase, partial [Planctomycetota bacterium]